MAPSVGDPAAPASTPASTGGDLESPASAAGPYSARGSGTPGLGLFLTLAGLVVVLDQVTKFWVIKHLTRAFGPSNPDASLLEELALFWSSEHPSRGRVLTVVEDFWHLRYVENTGAAWGLFAAAPSWFRTPFFLVVSLSAMTFIVSYFRRALPDQRLVRAALPLVFGGALGNFFDRLRLGYVIDFVDWHWYDRVNWPTFNVADAGISTGVILLLVDLLRTRAPAPPTGTAGPGPTGPAPSSPAPQAGEPGVPGTGEGSRGL